MARVNADLALALINSIFTGLAQDHTPTTEQGLDVSPRASNKASDPIRLEAVTRRRAQRSLEYFLPIPMSRHSQRKRL